MLSQDVENIRTQIQFSKKNTDVMKSIPDGFNNRLHTAEEKTYELEDGQKNERWWVAVYLRRKHSELGELRKLMQPSKLVIGVSKGAGREKSI